MCAITFGYIGETSTQHMYRLQFNICPGAVSPRVRWTYTSLAVLQPLPRDPAVPWLMSHVSRHTLLQHLTIWLSDSHSHLIHPFPPFKSCNTISLLLWNVCLSAPTLSVQQWRIQGRGGMGRSPPHENVYVISWGLGDHAPSHQNIISQPFAVFTVR